MTESTREQGTTTTTRNKKASEVYRMPFAFLFPQDNLIDANVMRATHIDASWCCFSQLFQLVLYSSSRSFRYGAVSMMEFNLIRL